MNGRKPFFVIIAVLLLLVLLAVIIVGRSMSNAVPKSADTVSAADPVHAAGSAEASAAAAEPGRQDGERFEEIILLEGMEEAVRYEHVRNESLGFEIDYDYESFERRGGAERECFLSCWDDPENPENYLEVTYSAKDADAVAAAIGALLSNTYEISRDDSFRLERAGGCIRIDASADVGGKSMPDQLQMVYIIPAADGCRIASAHYAIEASEGFGRRFRYMMDTFSPLPVRGEKQISDERALSAVKHCCHISDPGLARVEKSGEYPVYWEISSRGEREIVVLYRSYTGAQIRYHIDPFSGETFVTEFVPGITAEETRTGEVLNLWDYSF